MVFVLRVSVLKVSDGCITHQIFKRDGGLFGAVDFLGFRVAHRAGLPLLTDVCGSTLVRHTEPETTDPGTASFVYHVVVYHLSARRRRRPAVSRGTTGRRRP